MKLKIFFLSFALAATAFAQLNTPYDKTVMDLSQKPGDDF